jgi:electron transport complex protein RnfA
MSGVSLALLAIFSGLSMNLVFQFGLGIREITHEDSPRWKPVFIKQAVVFIVVILLWLVFSKISAFLPAGFLVYLLLFPASALGYYSLEYLVYRFLLKGKAGGGFCDGFASAALVLCFTIAGTFTEALVLSGGFVFGVMLAILILGEIRRRSMLEAVPKYLRGSPLVLVSMGLLSLIFSSAAYIFYSLLGAK